MKKIRCYLCAKIWYIEDNELQNQKCCPYCASSIRKEVQPDNFDTLDKALYNAVMQYGKNIFTKPSALSSCVIATSPNLKTEMRVFSKILTNDYINDIMQVFDSDVQTTEAIISKIKQRCMNYDGLKEDWAEWICGNLLNTAMYVQGIDTSRLVADITDVSDIPGGVQNSIGRDSVQIQNIPDIHNDVQNDDKTSDNANQSPDVRSDTQTNAEENPQRKVLKSDKGGAKITWKLYDDGTLEFEGTDAMYNFDLQTKYPWYKSKDKIEKVVIREGITTIGSHSFREYKNLCEVILPDSLKRIGDWAFAESLNISELIIGKNVEVLGSDVFYHWTSSQAIFVQSQTIASLPDYEVRGYNYNSKAQVIRI